MISGMIQTIDEWVGAREMFADSGRPPSVGILVTTNESLSISTWDFDQTMREMVWFNAPVRGKTVAFDFYWTCTSTSGSGGVYWAGDSNAVGPDSTLDVAADNSSAADTMIATEIMHVARGSRFRVNPVGPGGVFIAQISREPANVADTLNADARLIGVMLRWL